MFGVDFSEVVLIFGLALVVLGPQRLPKVAATIGRWVGRARSMARQFREQLEQEANAIRQDIDPHLNTAASPPPPPPPPASPAPPAPTEAAPEVASAPAAVPHPAAEAPATEPVPPAESVVASAEAASASVPPAPAAGEAHGRGP